MYLNKCVIIFLCTCALSCLTAPVIQAAGQSSTHYEITEDVIAQGGGVATGGVYENTSTTGQPSGVEINRQGAYENQSGFWHTVLIVPPIPTLSGIGILLLTMTFSFFFYRKRRILR